MNKLINENKSIVTVILACALIGLVMSTYIIVRVMSGSDIAGVTAALIVASASSRVIDHLYKIPSEEVTASEEKK